jgi:hypothetical protein
MRVALQFLKSLAIFCTLQLEIESRVLFCIACCVDLQSELWHWVNVLQVSTVLLCGLLPSELWHCVDVLPVSTVLLCGLLQSEL